MWPLIFPRNSVYSSHRTLSHTLGHFHFLMLSAEAVANTYSLRLTPHSHLHWVEQARSDAFLVMRQDRRRVPTHQIPGSHSGVSRPRHHLRLSRLCGDAVHCTSVASQHHHLCLRANVPDATNTVSPAGEQDVQCGMGGDAVHAAEMAMIGAHHLRSSHRSSLTRLYSRSQHFTDLSSPQEKRYGERADTTTPRTVCEWPVSVSFRFPDARSQIYSSPALLRYLDRAIRRARDEPLVAHVHRHTANPAKMACNHTSQLPGSVPLWNWSLLVSCAKNQR